MSDLETLFTASKNKSEKKRLACEKSEAERQKTLERNIDFALRKLSFVTKNGGSFLRFGCGFQTCWINVMSPRFGNIGGIALSGTDEINDRTIMRQTFEDDKGMSWEGIAAAIGERF